MKTRLLCGAAALLLTLAGAAQAGQAVTLRAETLDADGVVTLGDLFDGAGSAAEVRVAAKPGLSIVLDAGAVQQMLMLPRVRTLHRPLPSPQIGSRGFREL